MSNGSVFSGSSRVEITSKGQGGVAVDSGRYSEQVTVCGRSALEKLFSEYQGPVSARLWDGTAIGNETPASVIAFRYPGPLRELILRRDILRLAERYLEGAVDVEGDMETLFDFVGFLHERGFSLKEKVKVAGLALCMPSCRKEGMRQTTGKNARPARNDRRSIGTHYDLSNEFYSLWLDPKMVYSCAYFRDAQQSLAEAQDDKLDYICRKLRLEPGMSLLDIGCGWGSLAIRAAKKFGVRVHGITLSECQRGWACAEAQKQGLEDLVRVDIMDYRDLPDDAAYDRIVSVGMFEHIGVSSFPVYFGAIKRLLKPRGLFLNHGINNDSGWGADPIRSFVNKYVFPDGELTRVCVAIEAMENEGFEIIDVENLRRHYIYTLRRWVRNLEARREEAVALVGEKTYRIWRLYMAGSAWYFGRGSSMVFQTLAGHKGMTPVPLRRDDLYV